MNRPQTVAVTAEEGGEWVPFVPWHTGIITVHSIRFDDGSIWDALNGWRPETEVPEVSIDLSKDFS